jgi:hypothetical protein
MEFLIESTTYELSTARNGQEKGGTELRTD